MAAAKKRRSKHYDEPGAYERRLTERRERDERPAIGDDDEDEAVPGAWWAQTTDDACANAAWGWMERLRKHHRIQSAMDAIWEAVYNDTPIGLTLDGSAALARARADTRIKLAKSMVGTMKSRISKRRPMPCISADDAGWTEKRYAMRASRVLRRKMGQGKVERLCPMIVGDGLIRGTGVAKVFRDGGDVGIEGVPRREVLVDPQESRYGDPRLMAQVKRASRDVLCAMFPEHKDFIRSASRAPREEWEPYETSLDADQVEVGECWKLPTSPGADDGCHVIVMRGKLLKREVWKRMRFPFAFFHWCRPPIGTGYWGTGLVSEAAPTQKEVNDTLRDMGEAISLAHQLKIFVSRGSNIDKNHLRARNPAVIEHDGQAPQYVAPTPFSQAVLEYLKWRISQAYETVGISQASAASKNPLGSNASGKALDTMYDLESDRFADVELEYSMFRVDLGQLMLDEARDIAECEDDSDVKVAPWITGIDWDKLDIDSGTYHLILEPVNFLPDARSGKLAGVKEMTEAGLLQNPMQSAALFEEPDIARANRYLLGPYKRIEKWLEDLANVDVPLEECTPDPFLAARADMAKEMCLGEMDMAIAEEADEEVLGRYRWALQMLKAAVDELAQQEAAAAAPAGMPGAMPTAPADPMAAGAAMPMDPNMMMPPPIDPMGGATAQLAAGMPVDLGAMVQ